SPLATYTYMTAGDVTRLANITQAGRNWSASEQFDYNPQGLLATRTVSYPGQSPLVLTYSYDPLNRLAEEVYPIEYGTPSLAKKTLDSTYGMGGPLTDLKVDGVDYASQIAHNPAGQITSITVGPPGPQQTTDTYNFDPSSGLLFSQKVQRGASMPP